MKYPSSFCLVIVLKMQVLLSSCLCKSCHQPQPFFASWQSSWPGVILPSVGEVRYKYLFCKGCLTWWLLRPIQWEASNVTYSFVLRSHTLSGVLARGTLAALQIIPLNYFWRSHNKIAISFLMSRGHHKCQKRACSCLYLRMSDLQTQGFRH
jgi:hypothetical protein